MGIVKEGTRCGAKLAAASPTLVESPNLSGFTDGLKPGYIRKGCALGTVRTIASECAPNAPGTPPRAYPSISSSSRYRRATKKSYGRLRDHTSAIQPIGISDMNLEEPNAGRPSSNSPCRTCCREFFDRVRPEKFRQLLLHLYIVADP